MRSQLALPVRRLAAFVTPLMPLLIVVLGKRW
jgi:hypothetical protein